jgi:hypothetical protein
VSSGFLSRRTRKAKEAFSGYLEEKMPLPLDADYTSEYSIYSMCDGDITKKKYIEENYNNEDFFEWICLSQFHYHSTKEK